MDVDGDGRPDVIAATGEKFGRFRNPDGVRLVDAWEYQPSMRGSRHSPSAISMPIVGWNWLRL
jgi:hypothetical protein